MELNIHPSWLLAMVEKEDSGVTSVWRTYHPDAKRT